MIYEQDFLKKLDLEKNKTIFAKVTLLSLNELPIKEITGQVTEGSISIDGTSIIRRTCNLTLVTDENMFLDYYWTLKSKVQIELGVQNQIDNRYPEIIWYPQGIYILTNFSCTKNTNNCQITVSGQDKMSKLNGTLGGSFSAETVLDSIQENSIYYELIEDEESFGVRFDHFIKDCELVQLNSKDDLALDTYGYFIIQDLLQFKTVNTLDYYTTETMKQLFSYNNVTFFEWDENLRAYVVATSYKENTTYYQLVNSNLTIKEEEANARCFDNFTEITSDKKINFPCLAYRQNKYSVKLPITNFDEKSIKTNKIFYYDETNDRYSTETVSGYEENKKEKYYRFSWACPEFFKEDEDKRSLFNGVADVIKTSVDKKKWVVVNFEAEDNSINDDVAESDKIEMLLRGSEDNYWYLPPSINYSNLPTKKRSTYRIRFKRIKKDEIYGQTLYPRYKGRLFYTRNYDITQKKIPIKQIITELVHEYGQEPYHNIILEDIPDYGKEMLTYIGEEPLYLFKSEHENKVLNKDDKLQIVDKDSIVFVKYDNLINYDNEESQKKYYEEVLGKVEKDSLSGTGIQYWLASCGSEYLNTFKTTIETKIEEMKSAVDDLKTEYETAQSKEEESKKSMVNAKNEYQKAEGKLKNRVTLEEQEQIVKECQTNKDSQYNKYLEYKEIHKEALKKYQNNKTDKLKQEAQEAKEKKDFVYSIYQEIKKEYEEQKKILSEIKSDVTKSTSYYNQYTSYKKVNETDNANLNKARDKYNEATKEYEEFQSQGAKNYGKEKGAEALQKYISNNSEFNNSIYTTEFNKADLNESNLSSIRTALVKGVDIKEGITATIDKKTYSTEIVLSIEGFIEVLNLDEDTFYTLNAGLANFINSIDTRRKIIAEKNPIVFSGLNQSEVYIKIGNEFLSVEEADDTTYNYLQQYYWKPKQGVEFQVKNIDENFLLSQWETENNKPTFKSNNESGQIFKINQDDTCGYRQTELIYADDLICGLGTSVTAALDKIKSMLGEYEYFYDIDGKFRFRRKRTYLNNPFSILDISTEDERYAVNYFKSKYIYNLDNYAQILSFSHNPVINNVKNDFSIWGERKTVTGNTVPIYLRYAIDEKPARYESPWTEKIFTIYDKETYEKYYGNAENLQEKCDWRELIYQMAADFSKYGTLDPENPQQYDKNFNLKLSRSNQDLCTTFGLTGYEQYYTDLLGFWRTIYNPFWDFEINEEYDKRNFNNEHWIKTISNPENLNFWFDFLTSDNELNKFSVRKMGDRLKTQSSDKFNAVKYKTVPLILFSPSPNSKEISGELKAYDIIEIEDKLNENFTISTRGQDLSEACNNLVYENVLQQNSLTLSTIPIYYLEPNSLLQVNVPEDYLNGEYILNKINYTLAYNGQMSLSLIKKQNYIV